MTNGFINKNTFAPQITENDDMADMALANMHIKR